MTEKKIGICVPLYGGISAVWVQSFVQKLSEWSAQDLRIEVCMSQTNPVDRARCELVSMALNKGCDYIFFLDSDVLIPPNTIHELLDTLKNTKSKVATGVYFIKGEPHYPVLRYYSDDDKKYSFHTTPLTPHQEFKVDGCGAGCLLIDTTIFKDLEEPYFNFSWKEWRGIKNQGSEDLYFCKKVRDSGHEIWVNTNVLCGHIGGVCGLIDYTMFQPAIQRLAEDKKEIIHDIMEYTNNKDYFDVLSKLKKGAGMMQEAWIKKNPKTPEEIKEFYENAEEYIYDLAGWHVGHRREYDDNIVQDMLRLKAKSILDYGCGIGQNLMMIKKYAKIDDLVGADLNCPALKFAKYRNNKHNYGIKFWELGGKGLMNPNKKFDVILCVDVLEHLSDNDFKKAIKLLKSCKHKDTKCYIRVAWGKTKSHPMHTDREQWKMDMVRELVECK